MMMGPEPIMRMERISVRLGTLGMILQEGLKSQQEYTKKLLQKKTLDVLRALNVLVCSTIVVVLNRPVPNEYIPGRQRRGG